MFFVAKASCRKGKRARLVGPEAPVSISTMTVMWTMQDDKMFLVSVVALREILIGSHCPASILLCIVGQSLARFLSFFINFLYI